MLVVSKSGRKPPSRYPFRAPCWHDDHPDWPRIDPSLPADRHARWLAGVVSRLGRTAFRLSYQGYGSLAYPVEILPAFVPLMYPRAIPSPAAWADEACHNGPSKWPPRGGGEGGEIPRGRACPAAWAPSGRGPRPGWSSCPATA